MLVFGRALAAVIYLQMVPLGLECSRASVFHPNPLPDFLGGLVFYIVEDMRRYSKSMWAWIPTEI